MSDSPATTGYNHGDLVCQAAFGVAAVVSLLLENTPPEDQAKDLPELEATRDSDSGSRMDAAFETEKIYTLALENSNELTEQEEVSALDDSNESLMGEEEVVALEDSNGLLGGEEVHAQQELERQAFQQEHELPQQQLHTRQDELDLDEAETRREVKAREQAAAEAKAELAAACAREATLSQELEAAQRAEADSVLEAAVAEENVLALGASLEYLKAVARAADERLLIAETVVEETEAAAAEAQAVALSKAEEELKVSSTAWLSNVL